MNGRGRSSWFNYIRNRELGRVRMRGPILRRPVAAVRRAGLQRSVPVLQRMARRARLRVAARDRVEIARRARIRAIYRSRGIVGLW